MLRLHHVVTRSIIIAVLGVASGIALPRHASAADPINAVVGDTSWSGSAPERVDEVTRIRAHLTFALHRLRARDVSRLAPLARTQRRTSLHALERYIERGGFPRRIDDRYEGRRPRFIDDRGVYCAVGQLIADSGAPELAHAIDARFEYAYVREMRSSALKAWATTHGFTVDELAMIQPTYHQPVPGPERTRAVLEHETANLTLQCARRAPPSTVVSLHVHGDKQDRVSVTTTSADPFARCVADTASALDRSSSRRIAPIQPYTFDIELALPGPTALFESQLDAAFVPRECAPRPGNISREATIDVTSRKTGLVVHVTTRPPNAEINACVESEVAKLMAPFGPGIWSLHGQRTRPIVSQLTDSHVASSLALGGPTYATRCYPAKDPPSRLTIAIAAQPDDAQFTFDIDAGDPTFKRCVRDLLQTYLRTAYGVTRRVASITESYFRIDAAVTASATFDVQPPTR